MKRLFPLFLLPLAIAVFFAGVALSGQPLAPERPLIQQTQPAGIARGAASRLKGRKLLPCPKDAKARVLSVEPATASFGDSILILGCGFQRNRGMVVVDESQLAVDTWTDSYIQAIVIGTPGQQKTVRVITVCGESADAVIALRERASGVPATPEMFMADTDLLTSATTLTWSKSKNADGYSIERKDGESGVFEEIARVGQRSEFNQSYTDSSTKYQGRYYYRIRAYNSSGYSPYSSAPGVIAGVKDI